MPAQLRQDRLASLLHREIATTVAQDLTDPRLGMITITRVKLTPDLLQITAYWTVLGGAKERVLAEHALESARGYIQKQYAPAIRTRSLPQLKFRYDDEEQRRQGMDELIRRARASDADRGATPAAPAEDPPPG
jgi:ribosome-binding factor A